MLFLSLVSQADNNKSWWKFYDRTKAIHLQFTNKVRQDYEINIVWTPDGGLAPVLTGPALINFKSEKWGKSFAVMADYFHLPKSLLRENNLHIFDGEYSFDLSINLSRVYKIQSNSRHLKSISLWSNSHTTKSMSSDTRSHTPFFFEDIDLDGADELVVTSFQSGQRGVHEYLIYDLIDRYGTPDLELKTTKPFNQIDMLSTFNSDDKTILIHSSGGSCSSLEDTYKMIDGVFQHVQHTNWKSRLDAQYNYICEKFIYDIVNGDRTPRLRSGSH